MGGRQRTTLFVVKESSGGGKEVKGKESKESGKSAKKASK